MLARGVMLAMVLAPAAGFLAPASMLPLRASRSATCDRSALCMADEINSKQVAGYEQSAHFRERAVRDWRRFWGIAWRRVCKYVHVGRL